MWSSLKNYSDAALLFVRAAFGTIYLWVHTYPRLIQALRLLRKQGVHISHLSPVFNFLLAVLNVLACIFLILGLLFRPSALLLFCSVAFFGLQALSAKGMGSAAPHLELALFLFCLLFVGPGRFSFDKG